MSRRSMLRGLRATIDLLGFVLAWLAAYLLRFEGAIPDAHVRVMVMALPLVLLCKFAAMSIVKVNRHSWRYFGLPQALLLAKTLGAASALLLALRLAAPHALNGLVPVGVLLIDLVLTVLVAYAVRAIRRTRTEQSASRKLGAKADTKRVVLVGAGRAGVVVANELRVRTDLGLLAIGFLDDDATKHGDHIVGLTVLGGPEELRRLVTEKLVDEAILTIAAASGAEIRRLVRICKDAGVSARIIPGMHEIVGGQVELNRLRPVAIEDILGRVPVELNADLMEEVVASDVVLVTGAGGSIGSELCRQLARLNPSRLVLVERAEPAMWAVHRDLSARFPDLVIVPAIADITDKERIRSLMLEHRPGIVFHAAAHKHVPMMEWNPGEAARNNVFGTKVVVDAAVECGVERFVLISTDKAVNPSSIMGATKRVAELYVQHVADATGHAYVSVRFGNVLGSTGSVVPIFKEQISKGGPVKVTHPNMVRYFMTIREAAQLVIQAGALGQPGDVFVLDMGAPVKIVDLARDLIRLSGLEPDVDIKIEFTGIRPGEKMFEELAMADETTDRTMHPKIRRTRRDGGVWMDASERLTVLLELISHGATDAVRSEIHSLVPEFKVTVPVKAAQ